MGALALVLWAEACWPVGLLCPDHTGAGGEGRVCAPHSRAVSLSLSLCEPCFTPSLGLASETPAWAGEGADWTKERNVCPGLSILVLESSFSPRP